MDNRVALIGIIVEEAASAAKVNEILHEYGQYIVGRMGIPYRERNINIISVVVDAPQSIISAISGKIGSLPQVSAKTSYAKALSEA
ncbi:MAG: iron-only hydrogenase system regulator [Clostridia bacterium]|nr:iron-only hydrogenase system regulator [Clostridia bacterium]